MYNIIDGVAKFSTVKCSVNKKVGEFMELPLCANGWHHGRFQVVEAVEVVENNLAKIQYVCKQVA